MSCIVEEFLCYFVLHTHIKFIIGLILLYLHTGSPVMSEYFLAGKNDGGASRLPSVMEIRKLISLLKINFPLNQRAKLYCVYTRNVESNR